MEGLDIMSEEVRECEFYMQGWCCCGLTTVPKEVGYEDILCSDKCNNNCYYKQLFRLREENNSLTQQLKKAKGALNWLEDLLEENYNDEEHQIICVAFAYEKIQQVLKELPEKKEV